MRDIRGYSVFKLADDLVLDIYRITSAFPREELFALSAQMRRAAYSIPMNLVEGGARTTEREFAQFVNIAVGSCEELRYQLHLSCRLGYISSPVQLELDRKYEEVKRMLSRLLAKVTGRDSKQETEGQESGESC